MDNRACEQQKTSDVTIDLKQRERVFYSKDGLYIMLTVGCFFSRNVFPVAVVTLDESIYWRDESGQEVRRISENELTDLKRDLVLKFREENTMAAFHDLRINEITL